jgi:hypothetical protein
MKYTLLLTVVFASLTASLSGAELVLVKDGLPRAEIVLAEKRPRMTTLAALELRHFIEKTSGARLPIVTVPTAAVPVKIHVGRSAETDRLGVKTDGLRDGAYRIATGADWLVLIGHDEDFDPSKLPVPVSRNDIPRARAEWEKAIQGKSDAPWVFPFTSLFKGHWHPNAFHQVMTEQYGNDFTSLWQVREGVRPGFWNQDADGSLQAVYGLLRRFGVRWFMAGKLGEIVPEVKTVALAPLDETVKPDFAVRALSWYAQESFSFDDIIWARRLGMNSGYESLGPLFGPHGLVHVHGDKAMQQAHPDYYGLFGGKRDTTYREHGTACFSSTGLEAETVRYVRFLFDTYDLPCADIWPGDGLRVCQCEKCAGHTASDLVWGFADRVARQLYQSHPGKRITCGAYTSYVEPPESIAKFSPNLAVWISNRGRWKMLDEEHWADYQSRIRRWQSKLAPGNLLRLENNLFHVAAMAKGELVGYPVLHPRGVARDLKALKGVSLGDTGEQSQARGKWSAPALEHITLYVRSRFLWDADQDVDAVLDDYCVQFYGPAAAAMKEAITYAEQNLAFKDQGRRGRGNPDNVSLAVSLRLRELLESAHQLAGDTIYGRRIRAIIAELQPKETVIAKHREKEEALTQARSSAPVAKGVVGADLAKATAYKLKGYSKSVDPAFETTFRAAWDMDALVFDIVCKDPDMKKLSVTPDIHSGDYIAISLEPAVGVNYQISINPDVAVDDWGTSSNWKSVAEVKTERGNDFWRLTVRIPVVGADEGQADPNHRVSGTKPTHEAPWFFNVGRNQDLGGGKAELQAFSPTGAGWHVPAKFGKLEIK